MFTLESWSEQDYENFTEYLKSNADLKFRAFHSSLVPDTDSNSFIGIRMPFMRKLAKEISKGNAREFLDISKSEYYEQRIISAIVTGLIKTNDYDDFISLVNAFMPKINNWAVCDCFCGGLKEVKKYKKEFFEYLLKYLNSNNEWYIRFAFVMMLNYYLESEYIDEVLKRCDSVNSDKYYILMAQAWMLATAYAKQKEATHRYFLNNNLNDATFNKAIQKCIESLRVSDEDKKFLRTLKRH
ncbi:DNA alkylation repair protein [Ruminococcus sp.]|uniref:DNA alkylation repair protein n=1 Tax=Ruminococcus sp. TaxID=41978 RepID=UPI0038650B1C